MSAARRNTVSLSRPHVAGRETFVLYVFTEGLKEKKEGLKENFMYTNIKPVAARKNKCYRCRSPLENGGTNCTNPNCLSYSEKCCECGRYLDDSEKMQGICCECLNEKDEG